MTLTLDQQQYEALISLARAGTTGDADKARQLEEFLKSIEAANNVTRSILWVRWQEMDQPLPPATRFPDSWPPEQEYFIELISRRVARADVDAVIAARARKPNNIMVTPDPGARVGWTPVDDYFIA
jgi:hypothetical protein